MENKIIELQNELGAKLKLLRIARVGQGISEYQLARSLGFGDVTLYKIEQGHSLPSRRTLLQLKTTYNLTNDEFKGFLKTVSDIKKLKKQVKENRNL